MFTCPSWCEYQHNPHHQNYDVLVSDGTRARTHEKLIGTAGRLTVAVVQDEYRDGDTVLFDVPAVTVIDAENEPLTPEAARELAVLLQAAADVAARLGCAL